MVKNYKRFSKEAEHIKEDVIRAINFPTIASKKEWTDQDRKIFLSKLSAINPKEAEKLKKEFLGNK